MIDTGYKLGQLVVIDECLLLQMNQMLGTKKKKRFKFECEYVRMVPKEAKSKKKW